MAIQNDRKPTHRILLVLDGFDELKQETDGDTDEVKRRFKDCVEACGAGAWFTGQIKVVVTCRLRHITDMSLERQYFGRGLKKEFRHRVVLPFSSAQIDTYLQERTQTHRAESHLLPSATYISVMNASPSIKVMVRNPFVLRLFVDALPELQKQGRDLNATKRYDIYEAFVKQWFEREVGRFNPAHQAKLGVTGVGSERDVSQQFIRFAGILAIQMHKRDSLVVSYDATGPDSEELKVWNSLDETISSADIDESTMIHAIEASTREEYQKLPASKKQLLKVQQKIKTEDEYVAYKLSNASLEQKMGEKAEQVVEQLEAFKISSPLRKTGNGHSFIHKSFYEFFLAQAILQNAGSEQPLTIRVDNTLKCLSSAIRHESRRIQHEPQALLFIQDIWIGNSTDPIIERVKEAFFEVIEASKGHTEHGAAAANAITILNWMGTGLQRQSWQGIHIPGANLAYAQLTDSDLTGANLRGARLFRANLLNVLLVGADLTDVDFMERAPITTESECLAIAYHPTKPWIAMADGNDVRQYDTETGVFIGEPLEGHIDKVTSVSYSPDGTHLASSSNDKTVRQWVAATGLLCGPVLERHTRPVTSVVYAPNGLTLASASDDKTIRQWSMSTGEPVGPVCTGHTHFVTSVIYAPNGQRLASASGDKTIRQWDAFTGKRFGPVLEGHTRAVMCLAYAPNGLHLASGSRDCTIRQWDAFTGEPFGPVLEGHAGDVTSVTYIQNGLILASSSMDKTIRQWVAATGEPFGLVLEGHKNRVMSVAYAPNGFWIASGSTDKTIRQWSVSMSEFFHPVFARHTEYVSSVTYAPNGLTLASASADETIRQWVAATGEPFGPALKGHTKIVYSIAYAPNGLILASGSEDKTIRQWDAFTGEPFGPVLEGHTGRVISVAYAPNGQRLASTSGDKTIRQWDTFTGEPYGPLLKGHTDSIKSITYAPNGLTLASGSWDKTIRQWDAFTGEPFGPVLEGHAKEVNSVTYSPNGQWLASGSYDYTIRQWDAFTGEPFGPVLEGHAKEVNSVTYSLNGLTLASSSADKTIRQWVAGTGEPFGPVLEGHTSSVTSVAYSPSGLHLVSAGGDHRVCLWNSGVTGDFSLLWSTRSGANLLVSNGLLLRGAVGLRADQLALLAYAGYTETPVVASASAAVAVSSASFPNSLSLPDHTTSDSTGESIGEVLTGSGSIVSSTLFSQKKATVSSMSAEDFTAKAAPLKRRFIDSTTFQVLTQKIASTTLPMTKNDFESRQFDFAVSVDIIKTLADFYFGENKHNIQRGKQMYASILFSKINLTKELVKTDTSSTVESVTGKTILTTLKKCEGVLVESNQRGSLYEVVDVSWLTVLLETEQRSRGLEDVTRYAANDSASSAQKAKGSFFRMG